VLSTLVERELIAISGRGEGLGRPYLYSTTRKFLEYLGLKDHKDLPDMEELEKSFSAEQMPVERMSQVVSEAPVGERDGEESGQV
jgi:chromosome segregation and condensation protein ScpB